MKQQTRYKLFICLALVCAAGVTIFAMAALKEPPKKAEIKQKVWRIDVVNAVPGAYQPALPLYGYVQSPDTVVMKAAVTGDVAEVLALDGALVEKGDVLLRIDTNELQLRVTQANADLIDAKSQIQSLENKHKADQQALGHEQKLLALAKKELQRVQDLQKKKLTSQSNVDTVAQSYERQALSVVNRQLTISEYPLTLDQLRARQARAQAALEKAQIDLNYATVIAPFKGRVSAVKVSVGDRAQIGTSLLTLFDVGNAEVVAQIPNEYVPTLTQIQINGEKATGFAVVDDQRYPIVFDRLSGAVSRGKGGVDAFFKIESGGESLPLGRFVEASLDLPAVQNTLLVPATALFRGENVYRVVDGKLQRLNAKRIGQRQSDEGKQQLILAVENLQAGDQLLVTPLPNAVNGLNVEIAGEKPSE